MLDNLHVITTRTRLLCKRHAVRRDSKNMANNNFLPVIPA